MSKEEADACVEQSLAYDEGRPLRCRLLIEARDLSEAILRRRR